MINNNEILVEFIDELDAPIRIINGNNVIIYLNKNMIKLFGNLLGEPADIIFVHGYGKINDGNGELSKRQSRKQVYIGEALYAITSYPVQDKDGAEYQVEVFRDITEQKKIEAQLKNNYNKLLKETRFAKSIQNSILPIDDEYWNMIDIASLYLPADDLGGDIYDIVKLSNHETLMYMADVSGHGIRAALLTIFLREVVRGMWDIAKNEGLDNLLENLLKHYSALDIDAEMYFSIILCKYNKETGELSLANAGHNCFPMILRKKGRIEEIPLKGMPITRIGIENSYEEETIGIYPGDRVILYTDGIIEEYSEALGTEFGVQGMRNVISTNFDLPAKELCKKIIYEAERHSKARAKDDRSLMIVTIL